MEKRMKQFFLLLIILLISFSSACTFFPGKSKKWKPVKEGKKAFVHTVKWSDETFVIISKWYTGSTEHSEDLINANPTVNPEKLYVGNLIFIPKPLLQHTKELPRKYVDNFHKKKVRKSKKKKKESKNPEKQPENKDEFQLFGPR